MTDIAEFNAPIVLPLWEDRITSSRYELELFGTIGLLLPRSAFVIRKTATSKVGRSFLSIAYYPSHEELEVRQLDGNIMLPKVGVWRLEKLAARIWPAASLKYSI